MTITEPTQGPTPTPPTPNTPSPAPVARRSWAEKSSTALGFAIPYLLAVVAAFAVTAVIILLLGHDPFKAFQAVLTTSFKTGNGIVETFQKWTPITLLALAFAIPLAAGRFNIGGEGQLILGATGAVAVGITLSDLPAVVLLPLTLIAGTVAGGLWAGIAAWLMQRFKVNEILSTVLLNFVSFQLLDYVASEVWPNVGAGFPATEYIGKGAELPTIGKPPMHYGVLLTLLVVIAVAIWMRRSVGGFELKAVGSNERAAKVHGIRAGKVAVTSMLVAGALAGLAGSIEVAGVHERMLEGIQSNFLLLGIIVGLIARGSVVAVPFVAFGIAVLEVGASSMQRAAGVPVELVLITEGLILLFLLASDVISGRIKLRRKRSNG
jgi:simple sugar transport system permease protein